ncbi:hypothetical protein JJB11_06610 [Ramlibacter ginsenosidimutans]|uniref:Uncharacterized protein n=1 Tax=Ramlibacter ginsenosidimutans TaxID=502333 RepID=A0A934WM41_9BURK|nr:hypothetical protein [Ramlibacter ginsenosidimutans]MBK6005762.1 hypothetical protein [Ramlibacter ginsenosidimutans]
MIRFEPDSLTQALTRFFDMAAPDANVYVEIPAPDVRLAAVLFLAAAALVMWRRLGPGRRPTFAMLLVLLVSTWAWLTTSGNGRYFIPLLVCAGPIAIGLLCALPLTRTMKASIAFGLVVAQLFVLTQQPPWGTWSWADWQEAPYFSVELGREETQAPATTYVTISPISYSLIAPQFPANSRWVNITSADATSHDSRWLDEYLTRAARAGPVRLLAPSLPPATLADGKPEQAVPEAFDKMIAQRHLRISGDCHLIRSLGQTRLEGRDHPGPAARPVGFWSCPLAYVPTLPDAARPAPIPAEVERAFQRLSVLCPRFFPSWEKSTLRVVDGWERHFSESDSRVYVLDNGQVWYKFWRALNPVLLGTREELVEAKRTLDCSMLRSDGAWQTGRQ